MIKKDLKIWALVIITTSLLWYFATRTKFGSTLSFILLSVLFLALLSIPIGIILLFFKDQRKTGLHLISFGLVFLLIGFSICSSNL